MILPTGESTVNQARSLKHRYAPARCYHAPNQLHRSLEVTSDMVDDVRGALIKTPRRTGIIKSADQVVCGRSCTERDVQSGEGAHYSSACDAEKHRPLRAKPQLHPRILLCEEGSVRRIAPTHTIFPNLSSRAPVRPKRAFSLQQRQPPRES